MDSELKEFVKDIKKTFSDAKILLFGSRVNGTAKETSDYDLIVISQSFKKIPFANRAYKIWINTSANIAADLLCYSPDEFPRVANNSVTLKDALKHAIPL